MKNLLAKLVLAIGLISPAATSQVPDFYDPDSYREIRLTFAQTNWWSLLVQNYGPEIDIPATMVCDGKTYPNVGVRFRGNTSYTQLPPGSEKKCFNINMDTFVPGQDIYGYSQLNLNNGFHDPTFMREFLGYWICRQHGVAPRANFVKLYLNGTYWGVYINVQQPNKDMMRSWFRSNDGNRYRCFPTSGTFGNGRCAYTWLGTTLANYLAAYQAKQGDGSDLMNFCNVLNNTPTAQIQTALPPLYNVDQFYRYASCMNVMTNDDSYIGSGKDHFLYHDEINGQFFTFPFDLNETLAGNTSLLPTYNTTGASYPAFSKTLVVPEWNQRYLAHYRTVFEDTVNWAYLGPIVTKYRNMIAADVAADTKKIYTTQQFTDNLTMSVSTSTGVVPGLKTLIDARYAFLKSQAVFSGVRPTIGNLAHSPKNPTTATPVTITCTVSSNATSVRLWSRVLGPFTAQPLYDDGQHGDGAANDGVYGVVLSPFAAGSFLEYYVEASVGGSNVSFWPKTAELAPPSLRVEWPTGASPIKINEFVAQNVTGILDENSQHEDWIELYNSSAQAVSVAGMYLTDDQLLPKKWQFPVGTTIPAYGTLLVWADEDGTQGPMHASFKLSAGGEEIALFATDGQTRLDYYRFGVQQADIATARLFDAFDLWVTMSTPTPRSSNQLPGPGFRKYSALFSPNHPMDLAYAGTPKIGATGALVVGGGPAAAPGLLVVAPLPGYFDLSSLGVGRVTLLLDAPTLASIGGLAFDAQGNLSVPLAIPLDPALVGSLTYFQVLAAGSPSVVSSNAIELLLGQ